MKKIPTIEECFAIYMAEVLSEGIDPVMEELHRVTFFCGFESCMRLFDAIAELLEQNAKDGQDAWHILDAEYEQFAIERELGKPAITH